MLSGACSSPNIITFAEVIDLPRQNTLILPSKEIALRRKPLGRRNNLINEKL